MTAFGERIRELRKSKGYSLRELGPLVDVGFTYLSKVERGKLDFGDYPSTALIQRLAKELDADPDELMLLAKRIPESIATKIMEQPEVFRFLASCETAKLQKLAEDAGLRKNSKKKKPR
ncbi:helix-turn-helix domain-containing protein [Rhodopirellula sallentina]|uniref:XRE family transcriptional regulator n=1 Tax=Rhodopirellula sallentina SM41 TaxID=1263870 RepID=M5U0X3_9BACT|nr:helix-turn-helix transcriptional regulator [Rhodopirellula sallentina]EMI55095.1 XRE family transcriptional regulator [Rhodopirellula sallentina SM41]